MKKNVFLLFICVVLFTGCGNKKATYTCTRTTNQSGLSLDLKYTVSTSGKYVTNIKTEEKLTTDDESVFTAYKSQIESMLAPYKNIKYYDADVKVEGNTLTSITNINYEKINTDDLLKIDSGNQLLIKDGKILFSDVERYYNQLGIICSK